MRVSKVKVDKNNMVLMHRKTDKGSLIFENNKDQDRTKEILPHKKKQSFELSILNKTIIRENSLKSLNLDKRIYYAIRNIFQKGKLPDSIEKEKIPAYLNHRFQVKMKYKNGNELFEFYLPDLIYEAVKEKSIDKLKPYFEWKKWYINTKSDILIKSIENNRINIDQTTSKRKRTLQLWANEYTKGGNIDLNHFHSIYEIDKLVKALNLVDKGELDTDKGTPKNTNVYHRALKKILQEHQKIVFGTREAPHITNRANEQLAIYHLEVVKYLEHYFSVKSTKRKNTKDDIEYYLKGATIKNTIQKQLINAVRSSLLQQGKATHHAYNNTTTSDSLTTIKRNEAFVLNLIDSCAFAANNIRNIVDNEQNQDIIAGKEFRASIDKQSINPALFKLFFDTNLPTTEPDKTNALWAMRGAVQQIRNEVVHYKQGALSMIFNISEAEIPTGKIFYNYTIYKKCLEDEIKQLPETIALQLKTGGVLSYYKWDDLKLLFENFPFTLSRSVVPFAPGFKKVMTQGINYQTADKDKFDQFYDLEISHYTEKNKPDHEAYEARYYLLKLIYNNLFLENFTSNEGAFSNAIKFVLEKNKKHAENSGNKFAFAFAEIRAVNENEKITDYMAYVQSNLNLEQNKKEDEKDDEKHIHFQNFVKQVFIKGFDTWLNNQKFNFISQPLNQLGSETTNNARSEKLNKLEEDVKAVCSIKSDKIKTDEPGHIAFYTFCKLLDANHLSNLRNELIKFISAGGEREKHIHLFELIELCLLKADNVPANYKELYATGAESLDLTKKFIEPGANIENWSDLFVQSDKTTPVVHANIELSRKYGTLDLLENLIKKDVTFKVKETEFLKWYGYQAQVVIAGDTKGKTQSLIAEKISTREKLHKEWEAIHKNKEKLKVFFENKGNEYIRICKEIDEYNWLDNKLHFVHLKRLHQLIIDILGRMAGFVALWERDFQFLSQFIEVTKGAIPLDFSRGLPKENKFDKNYYNTIFLSGNYRDTRNHIAHFNFISTNAQKYSLINLVNELRDLMHYDRKLKNAITKAIIDLFDKHGMTLKLKFNYTTHQVEIDKLEPKKLKHLGRRDMLTNQVDVEYCQLCKTLLEFKK